MTQYYPPCSPEDGEGAPCGLCSLRVCCYEHWETIHKVKHKFDEEMDRQVREKVGHTKRYACAQCGGGLCELAQ